MFGSKKLDLQTAERKLKQVLCTSPYFAGCRFEILEDRKFVSFQTSEGVGMSNRLVNLLCGVPGTYEGFVSMTAYRDGELSLKYGYSRKMSSVGYIKASMYEQKLDRSRFKHIFLIGNDGDYTEFRLFVDDVTEFNIESKAKFLIESAESVLFC